MCFLGKVCHFEEAEEETIRLSFISTRFVGPAGEQGINLNAFEAILIKMTFSFEFQKRFQTDRRFRHILRQNKTHTKQN